MPHRYTPERLDCSREGEGERKKNFDPHGPYLLGEIVRDVAIKARGWQGFAGARRGTKAAHHPGGRHAICNAERGGGGFPSVPRNDEKSDDEKEMMAFSPRGEGKGSLPCQILAYGTADAIFTPGGERLDAGRGTLWLI